MNKESGILMSLNIEAVEIMADQRLDGYFRKGFVCP